MDDDFLPVGPDTPTGVWLRTRRDGENGQNVCMLQQHPLPCDAVSWDEVVGIEDEWIERDTGRTTVTHHSFASPTHWAPMERKVNKPILSIDFDGVVFPYSKGWQDGVLYETSVVPGFFEWATEAARSFRLIVYSSRSKDEDLRNKMAVWLVGLYVAWQTEHGQREKTETVTFEFAHEKPPAFLTIDDRAMQFRGDWSAWWLAPERLKEFKPWTQAAPPPCAEPALIEQVQLSEDGDGVSTVCYPSAVATEKKEIDPPARTGPVLVGQVRLARTGWGVLMVVSVAYEFPPLCRAIIIEGGLTIRRALSFTFVEENYPTVLATLKKE